jgi:hypothetical protein
MEILWHTIHKDMKLNKKINVRHKYMIWWVVTWRIMDGDVECLHAERNLSTTYNGFHVRNCIGCDMMMMKKKICIVK